MSNTQFPSRPWPLAAAGSLPERMRVLFVTTPRRPARWLADALAVDSASRVELAEVPAPDQAAARLRDELFDAALILHDPTALDGLELIEALRGGGCDVPLVLLAEEGEVELSALSFEVGADAFVPLRNGSARSLLWALSRAIERQTLLRENRRLEQAARHRLRQEKSEAERLLEHQRAVIADLHARHCPATEEPADAAWQAELAPALVQHYHELLRAHVIMGSGSLAQEMRALAELLGRADFSARQTLQLHLQVVEAMIQGLGSRSTRHVMTRADLLILELMIHLAEHYRRRAVGGTPPSASGGPTQHERPHHDRRRVERVDPTVRRRAPVAALPYAEEFGDGDGD